MRAVAVLVGALLCARSAAADDPRPVVLVPAADLTPEEEPYLADFRRPWRLVIGFDFGIGVIDLVCAGCHSLGGLHVDVFAGVQVARRVALLAEVWSLVHLLPADDPDNGLAAHTLATAGSRVWVAPRLWVQAGGGIGRFTAEQAGPNEEEHGPAAVLAVGGEPGHRWCSGIDLSLRAGGTLVDGGDAAGRVFLYNIGAAVGFHWN